MDDVGNLYGLLYCTPYYYILSNTIIITRVYYYTHRYSVFDVKPPVILAPFHADRSQGGIGVAVYDDYTVRTAKN